MSKRIKWLDISKGIGILLVVLGHCLNIEQKPFQFIFVFHMPLFFILSGYLYSDSNNLREYIRKKNRALILPYLEFFLLGFAVTMIIPQWRVAFLPSSLVQTFWFAYPESVHNSSIWFLVCLFWVSLFCYLIHRLPVWMQAACVSAVYSSGIWYSRHRGYILFMGNPRLPFVLDAAMIAVLFFYIGIIIRKYDIIERVFSSWKREGTCFVCFCVLTVFSLKINGYVNLHALSYNNPIVYIIGGVSGSMMVIMLSRLLLRVICHGVDIFVSGMMWYGRHSLMILGLQSLLIRIYILIWNDHQGRNLILYQFPWKHTSLSFVLVGCVLCPVVCFVADVVKQNRKKRA